MQIVENNSFFSNKFYIKYVTPWENYFETDLKMGIPVRFYHGDSTSIVEVTILADRNKLTSNDITVYLGCNHNDSNIKARVFLKQDEILELCKSIVEMEFILDLDTMKRVTSEDFILTTPLIDCPPFFITKDNGDPFFKMLVNPNDNIFNTNEIFTWFLSALLSPKICVKPIDGHTAFARFFIQGISCLAYGKPIELTKDKSISNIELGHLESLAIPFPGSTMRIKKLLENLGKDIKKQ